MKAEVELLKADIRDEMNKIGKVYDEFIFLKKKLDQKEAIDSYDKAAMGYLIHNFYSGCENIFRSIARFFENDFTNRSWHRNLLKRMALDVTGFRPRVISEDLFVLLDDFRSFRHKFRYSYSFELDWEREKIVANKLNQTWEMFQDEMDAFLGKLDLIK